MNNNLLLTNILQALLGTELIIGFVIFVIISYLLVALLTWSFTKPLKYLSIPFMIVGVIILILRFSFPFIITAIPQNELNIPNSIVNALLSPFLKSGIICLLAGIIAMTGYVVIGKVTKKNSNKKDKTNTNEKETTNNEQ